MKIDSVTNKVCLWIMRRACLGEARQEGSNARWETLYLDLAERMSRLSSQHGALVADIRRLEGWSKRAENELVERFKNYQKWVPEPTAELLGNVRRAESAAAQAVMRAVNLENRCDMLEIRCSGLTEELGEVLRSINGVSKS